MRRRPRSYFVLKLKARRCGKCGGKINPHQTRCKKCHAVQSRPQK